MGAQFSAPCSSGQPGLACWSGCTGEASSDITEVVISPSVVDAETSIFAGGDGVHYDEGPLLSACGGAVGTSAALASSASLAVAVASSASAGSQQQESAGTVPSYRILDALTAVLRDGDVVLVRGSWLVELSRRQSKLPRRQELPPEAVCSVDMVSTCPIVVISYCWKSPDHPDPHCEHLRTLGIVIEQWIRFHRNDENSDIAVFIDWCSLYQEPRTVQEHAAFQRSLRNINIWYAHQQTRKWMLTKAMWGVRPYGERGWPTFERAVSQLITPGCNVLDLGLLDGRCKDWLHTSEVCRAGQRPPVVPDFFARELCMKAFTNSDDQGFVERKYRQTFEDLMGSASGLIFGCRGWGDDEACRLAEVIPRCGRLQRLDLRDNCIGEGGAEVLAAAIPHCVCLQDLDLCGNEIGDTGALKLAKALPCCQYLRRLSLAGNTISDVGVEPLAAAIPSCGSLHELCLGRNEIGDAGAETIAAAIPDCANLQGLELHENEISDVGAAKIASAILRCGRLRKLDLARNRVGDGGAELFARAIPRCSSLREFGLGGNEIGEILGGSRIGDGGMGRLAEVIPLCGCLRKLDLSENQIGNGGTERLAVAIPDCNSLTEIELSKNRIGDDGAAKLAEVLPRCSGLKKLALIENLLGDVSRHQLREAWCSNGKLEEQLSC